MRYTDTLREAAGEQWTRVTHHKFTDDLAESTISKEVLSKYLIQDHRFLDAFVCLLSSIIAKARCLGDRIEGCQFLALITGKENTYFERSLKKLGWEKNDHVPDADCTKAFVGLMRDVVENGTLAEMLAVIVVCEWSYLSWGERVLSKTVRKDDSFECYEWVDLHSGEYFASVIEYLRGLLDKEGTLIDEDEKIKVKKRFLQAVQCEEDFFDYAYSTEE